MSKTFGIPVPQSREDRDQMANALVNKAKESRRLVSAAIGKNGVVLVSPDDTEESVRAQIVDAMYLPRPVRPA